MSEQQSKQQYFAIYETASGRITSTGRVSGRSKHGPIAPAGCGLVYADYWITPRRFRINDVGELVERESVVIDYQRISGEAIRFDLPPGVIIAGHNATLQREGATVTAKAAGDEIVVHFTHAELNIAPIREAF